MRDGVPTTEYDIQALMMAWFDDEGLITDSAPIVAAQENAGNPHYQPTADGIAGDRPRRTCVLLDLWGKLPTPGAVFADISWMGFTGAGGAGRRHARPSAPRATRATPRSR